MATGTAKKADPAAAWLRRRLTRPSDWSRIQLLALAFAGGSVDAFTYLEIGHAFPANMTGNTVLVVLAVVRGAGTDAARSGIALAGYCLGVAAGTYLVRGRARWPGNAAPALGWEAAVLAALLIYWVLVGVEPRYALIGAASMAMGSQSAAVRASHIRGVSTTYVTGTLTTAVAGLVMRLPGQAPRNPEAPALPGGAWIVYALGAFAGALAGRAWHAWVVAIPLAVVLTVALAGIRSVRR